jgi:hypothetical protein
MSDLHPLILQVRSYLEAANAGASVMAPEVLDEAAAAFRSALDRQFNRPETDKGFRLRMSNIGSPFCRLWHEKNGTPGESREYNHPFKMVFGDAIEAAAIAVMRSAGVPIEATSQRSSVRIDVSDHDAVVVHGTDDLEIYGGIMDLKSASAYAFKEKFSGPYAWPNLVEHDDFGYLAQGAAYSKGRNKPFLGWVAISKETGEWSVLEIPKVERKTVLNGAYERAVETVRKLDTDAPFARDFEDEPEKFRGKPTGNRVLGTTCRYCPFKWECWPGLKYERQQASQAASPPFVYYTYLQDA